MKRVLVFVICCLLLGVSAVMAQSESSNAPFNGVKPVGTKGWVSQFSFPISTAGSYGAESDGTYIYVTKWNGDSIWKYTTAGVLVSGFKITGVTALRDLAYDGTYFYGGSNASVIYKMDFSTATLVGTINIPAAAGTGVTARNICYDPINDGLWVGAWGSNLALLNKSTGALMDTILSTVHGQTAMAGSAFDTVTAGGPYIWIITAASTAAEIHQINVATGLSTGVMHYTADDVNATAQGIGGGLFIASNLVSGTVTLGGAIQNALAFGYDLASAKLDSFDVALDNLNVPNAVLVNNTVQIKGDVVNKGMITLNSFDLHYRIDGGQINTQNVTGLTVQSNGTYAFTHNVNWTPTIAGSYALEVWANHPNGMVDANGTNDTLMKNVGAFDTIIEKKVLVEEATGAWCGYCPDGAVVLQQILAAHPDDVIGVAIHNADGMAFTDGNTVNSAYAQGYPNGWIDRVLFSDQTTVGLSRSIWAAKTAERLQDIVPMTVEAQTTYTPAGKVITIELATKFYSPANGDFRVNAFIVEDSVTGTGSQYNQVNNYNGTAGHPYYGAGNPIVGFKHRHVLRAMLGGPWGTSGVIPATVNKNDVFNKQYTYNVPAGVNPNRLSVVVLVQKYSSNQNDRPILNSNEYHLGVIDGIEEMNLNGDLLSLYPNPAEGSTSLEFMIVKPCNVNVEVFNLLGEKIMNQSLGNLPAGEYNHQIDVSTLSQGVYIVKADFGGNVSTQKLTVR